MLCPHEDTECLATFGDEARGVEIAFCCDCGRRLFRAYGSDKERTCSPS